ncbi:plasmid pRiA4b ORF-3 family protein, partial [Planococcus sp. SIMBA_143]
YPTLLDGAGTAPPADVGGLLGFASFLKKYHDQKDPDHDDVVQWAEMQQYREYDKTQINSRLKGIKYKKTEWT